MAEIPTTIIDSPALVIFSPWLKRQANHKINLVVKGFPTPETWSIFGANGLALPMTNLAWVFVYYRTQVVGNVHTPYFQRKTLGRHIQHRKNYTVDPR